MAKFAAPPYAPRMPKSRQRMLVACLAVAAITAAHLTFPSPAMASAGCTTLTPSLGQTITCTSAGTSSITVPADTNTVGYVVNGAGGGAGFNAPAGQGGGNGARVSGQFVGPFPSLTVAVGAGGPGGTTLGSGGVMSGGGGRGGGASSVTRGADIMVIAGGGGGGGGSSVGLAGGSGAETGARGGNGHPPGQAGQGGEVGFGGNGGSGGTHGANGSPGSGGTAPVVAPGGSGASPGAPAEVSGGNGGEGNGAGGGGAVTFTPSTTTALAVGGGGGGGSYAREIFRGPEFSPAGGAGGSTSGANGAAGSITLTFYGMPGFTAVTPSSGPTTGGTSLVLTGRNFTDLSRVTVGGATASFTVLSDTQLRIITPPGTPGAADLVLTGPGGSGSGSGFTYVLIPDTPTITAVTPSSGPVGSIVTITGTNLATASDVTFGMAGVTSLTIIDAGTVTVRVPPGSGTVDVAITNPDGTFVAANAFTFAQAEPVVSVSYDLTLVLGDGCANTRVSGITRTWITLPTTITCNPSSGPSQSRLLGWATRSDFPIAIAQRQVSNQWGVYELTNNSGELIAVFIPIGGAAYLTASNTLYAMLTE